MSTSKKRVASPILLPGGPESARDEKDFRPRPNKEKAGPKGESAPEPVATEQTVDQDSQTPQTPQEAPVLAPWEHPTTQVTPAPETETETVEPAPEPAPASTKSASKKPAAKRPAARPKRAPGNLLED